jgi:hypothetical protein
MKKVLLIVLAVVVIALAYILYQQIMTPLRFEKEVGLRKAAVIERIKDIRSAERAYKQINTAYTGSFDSLINFVLNDSLVFERSFGSADDSLAVAQGLVRTEEFKMAAIDTVFGVKKLTPDDVRQLRFIPFGDGKEYILEAGILETESKVKVPVFECKAPYKDFLSNLDEQELVNMIDTEKKMYNRYPGVKVGSMITATNDAGNWE